MAKYQAVLPKDTIDEFKNLYRDSDRLLEACVRAGAKKAAENMKANAPSELKGKVKLTKTYKTPTDGGINVKAYVDGYIPFSNPNRQWFQRAGANGKNYYTDKGVPASFLAILYEYGRSTSPFPKKPFLRKSFNASQIEKAMLEAQKEFTGGLLDE